MSNKIPCGGFYLDDMLNVNDSGELSIKGGTPYQQLVTDGEGNTVWEDRLAYVATEERVIFSQEDIAFTGKNGLYGAGPLDMSETISVGEKYRVNFDGETYDCIAYSDPLDPHHTVYIGNGFIIGIPNGTGEPFVIQNPTGPTEIMIVTALTSPTHTVSISRVVETVHTIPQVYLPKNYRVVFVITYGNEGSSSISCNCSYEELKSFCIGKSVPILGSLYDENEVKELIYIKYIEENATIYLQFNSGVGNDILKLNYKQDGSITRPLQ